MPHRRDMRRLRGKKSRPPNPASGLLYLSRDNKILLGFFHDSVEHALWRFIPSKEQAISLSYHSPDPERRALLAPAEFFQSRLSCPSSTQEHRAERWSHP